MMTDYLGGWHDALGFLTTPGVVSDLVHEGTRYAVIGPQGAGDAPGAIDAFPHRISPGSIEYEAEETEAGLWTVSVRFRIAGTLEGWQKDCPARAAVFIVEGHPKQPQCLLIGTPERPLQRSIRLISQRGEENYLGTEVVFTGTDAVPYRRALAHHHYGRWRFAGCRSNLSIPDSLRWQTT